MPSEILNRIQTSVKIEISKLRASVNHDTKKEKAPSVTQADARALTEPTTNIPAIFTKPESKITQDEYNQHTHSEDINAEPLGRWNLQHQGIATDNINSKLKRANTITEGGYRYHVEHTKDDEVSLLAPFALFRGVSLTSEDIQKMIKEKSTLDFMGCSHGDTYFSCTNKVANGYTIDYSGKKESVEFVVPQDYLPVKTYRAQTDLHAFKIAQEEKSLLDNRPISRVWKQTVPIYSIQKTYTSTKDYYNINVYDFKNVLFVELAPLSSKTPSKKSLVVDESLALRQADLDKLKKEHGNIRYAKYDVDIQPVNELIKEYLNKA
ncbi:MAG: hypothetical protein RLZZ210_499 [Pseudomonadota bacterium]|jgi:hypothetical protein